MFTGERFNAAKWADLYRRAGARFAGPVAEHHDGFSMWASVENPPDLMPLLIRVRPTEQVVHHLIDVVSKNGQLLLNVAPRADGSIPEDQRQLLLAIGAWLGRFGEAIYGTRPYVIAGHGPTEPPSGGGNLVPMPRYTPDDVRYTRDGDRVYALLLGWPGPGVESLLEGFAAEHGFEVRSVSVLG